MTFSSATKGITYYVETPGIRRLEQMCGSRLTELTQREKYQLAGVIAEWLAVMTDDPENETIDEDEGWTLLNTEWGTSIVTTNNVKVVLEILNDEDPEALAALLPAIAEYARDR